MRGSVYNALKSPIKLTCSVNTRAAKFISTSRRVLEFQEENHVVSRHDVMKRYAARYKLSLVV